VASFSHHTWSAAVQPVCHTSLTTVQRIIDFSLFYLEGLPYGQSSPKLEMTYYPSRSTILQNFSRSRKRSTSYALPKFFTFWPSGLTRGPKFTKRGVELVASQIYHPTKFRRPMSTHARDIPYKKSCGQTYTETNGKRYIPSMPIGMWG